MITDTGGGRPSARLAAELREDIIAGRIGSGQFLPTERDLAVKYKLARKTVGRALNMLEAEGLIISSPRHGHKVLSRAHDPARGAPLAYVRATPEASSGWKDLHGYLLTAVEDLAARRGWSILAMTARGRPSAEVFSQLRAARACGVLLDTSDPDFLKLVREAGMPALMIDTWVEGMALDSVLQDSYLGGMQAANWLISRGHKRIAWVGGIGQSFQSRERFGGALTALASVGGDIPTELRFTDSAEDDVLSIKRVLAGSNRPTAVLALWRMRALTVAAAARELGLVLGRDLDLVGWCVEEDYEAGYKSHFRGEPAAPAITWRVRDAAEAAMVRLVERRENPTMAPVQIRVPTRMKFAD